MRLTVAAGTRPEIIKLAPVVRALRGDGQAVRVIATGQHSDTSMAGDLFDDLGYQPDVTWSLPQDPADRLGKITALAAGEFAAVPADAVMVLGDTASVPLVALAARGRGVGVIHVEAGLRSFNSQSAEEINRRVMAAAASLNLAPTPLAAEFLHAEGVPERRIHVVGNPGIDALAESCIIRQRLADRRGMLFTAHRATNVDRPERLKELVSLLGDLGSLSPPVTFPLHPRTRARLAEANLVDHVLGLPGVELGPPLAYRDLLERLSHCQIVVTDSGGLQEEAAYFGVPTVIMRQTTPRWESIQAGIAVLAGVSRNAILDGVGQFLDGSRLRQVDSVPCPYGVGDAGQRIAALLRRHDVQEIIAPRERDFALPGEQVLVGALGGRQP